MVIEDPNWVVLGDRLRWIADPVRPDDVVADASHSGPGHRMCKYKDCQTFVLRLGAWSWTEAVPPVFRQSGHSIELSNLIR